MIKENTEVIKVADKVDDFLQSLFKALERQKSKDERRSSEKKVVVRRLPPTMNEERFLNEVSPLPDINYMYFIPGDPHAAPFHHSRVYLNFIKDDDMFMFTDKFDGYVFVDDTGDEYPAIVELAPYQRIPKKKLDKDPNWGKIHENPVFLEFKRNFEQKTIDTALKTTQHFFESVEDTSQEQDMSTPLLEYLAKQNDKQRERVNQRDERRKKVFTRKKEKEEVRRNKKEEKEVFIKPKPISKISTISKRVVEEKPVKDSSQKNIIQSHKDDSGFTDEKKKYYDDGYKVKSENTHKNESTHKFDEVKKIEFKLKTTKLNNPSKYFDSDSKNDSSLKIEKGHQVDSTEENNEVKQKSETSKPEKNYVDSGKENYEIKRKPETLKLEKSHVDSSKENYEIKKKSETLKPEKSCTDHPKESCETKKKSETFKSDYSETKTFGSSKYHKSYEDKEYFDNSETETHKRYRSDGDKKSFYNKRIDNRRQESKFDRRIRNKDRPAIEIYRPGMGRLSKIKSENDSPESESKN